MLGLEGGLLSPGGPGWLFGPPKSGRPPGGLIPGGMLPGGLISEGKKLYRTTFTVLYKMIIHDRTLQRILLSDDNKERM